MGAQAHSIDQALEKQETLSEALLAKNRMERITGASRPAPYLPPVHDGARPQPIDSEYVSSPKYLAFGKFPRVKSRHTYIPSLAVKPDVILRRPKGQRAKGFAPPRGPTEEHPRYSVFKLPTINQVEERKLRNRHL